MIRRSVPELSGTPTRIARRPFVVSHECADGACLGGGNARRAWGAAAGGASAHLRNVWPARQQWGAGCAAAAVAGRCRAQNR